MQGGKRFSRIAWAAIPTSSSFGFLRPSSKVWQFSPRFLSINRSIGLADQPIIATRMKKFLIMAIILAGLTVADVSDFKNWRPNSCQAATKARNDGSYTATSKSLKFNVKYEIDEPNDGYSDTFWFESDGTGLWAWEDEDYYSDDLVSYEESEFSWKKNADKLIITLKRSRSYLDFQTIYEATIINDTTIRVHTSENHWTNYRIRDKKVK